MPYALIPIGFSALMVYGFSFVLARVGLISQANHRKIWNVVLLLTFLVTAVLGIILAIQVNYKLEMPVVDKLIIWHVDFGIGMAFTSIFHFTWHWSYYWKMIQGKKHVPRPGGEILPADNLTSYREIPARDKLPLLTLGATALITQIVFLREYLAIFHGNELVIGLILAGWLLLTGTGALLGRNISPPAAKGDYPAWFFFLLGILPLVSVTGIRFFKNIIFPLGSVTGIPGILLYSTAGMFFFCILSGFLFTWLSTWISIKHRSNLLNFSYAVESAGSIAAGILFSFLLVHFLGTYQILFTVLLLNLATGITGRPPGQRRRILLLSGITVLVFAVLVFVFDLDLLSRSFLFRGQEVVEARDTPYGNLVVSKTGEQYNLFENSSPIAVTEDIASVEEDVHYAMLQHPGPGEILLFSGNLPGLLGELAKYPVRRVDFVELDPWITRMRNKYMPRPEVPWLREFYTDGRRYLSETDRSYDVVLVNMPPPGSAQVNRFYTSEFFAGIKSHLNPGGVLSVPLQGMENYPSGEALSLYSILYNTLRQHFRNILLVPGYKTYFLASDGELNLDIPSLVEERGIETVYVNSYYLDLPTLEARNQQLMSLISVSAGINRDFRPIAFLHQIEYWLSYFRSNLWITIGLFASLILLIGFRAGSLGTGIFITGFTGMATELVVLLAIQVVFGYVYFYTAVVLTVFMTGLAAGALSVRRILPGAGRRQFVILQLLLAGSVFLLLWWLLIIEGRSVPRTIMHAAFLGLTFLVSGVAGLLFGTAALLRKRGVSESAGGLYSADLAGSAAGALVTVVLMVPLLGLAGSLAVLLLLNLLAILNSMFRPSLN
jgi:spermidine synthase